MEPGEHNKESCKEVFDMLSEYLDRELSAATCKDIEAHLAGCPPCIEFLNSLKRTIRLCHDCESTEVPRPLTPAERDKLAAAYRSFLAANKR
jgi:RNA polymerase sigma-70 factor (ECF subfamily)